MKLNISFDCNAFERIRAEIVIRKCVRAVLDYEKVPVPCEINVLVTKDSVIREINKAQRNIDKETDVLSFPMFTFEPEKLPEDWSGFLDAETGFCPLGDMAMSLERAKAQAKEFGHSVRREVGYLTIHSMLHLLGYDHMDEGPMKAQMRKKEELIASTIPGMQR